MFGAIARARLLADFEREMRELKAKKPAAEDYLRKIDPVLWTSAFFPESPGRFGHDPSNIVESVNKTLKIDRQLSILELLNAIWHSQMALCFFRLQEANKYEAPFTKISLSQLELQNMWPRGNTVLLASLTIGRVQQPNGYINNGNLGTKSCGCRRFQQNGIPCGHAIACIALLRKHLHDFCPHLLSTSTWQQTYATNFLPVDISNLVSDVIFPPLTRVPRGRPKKERICPNEARNCARVQQQYGGLPLIPDCAPHQCSTCSNESHNARACKKLHN